jgi:hypothetical protein
MSTDSMAIGTSPLSSLPTLQRVEIVIDIQGSDTSPAT